MKINLSNQESSRLERTLKLDKMSLHNLKHNPLRCFNISPTICAFVGGFCQNFEGIKCY
jgi:hypothetical protein